LKEEDSISMCSGFFWGVFWLTIPRGEELS